MCPTWKRVRIVILRQRMSTYASHRDFSSYSLFLIIENNWLKSGYYHLYKNGFVMSIIKHGMVIYNKKYNVYKDRLFLHLDAC
jgi:hypothetical protein